MTLFYILTGGGFTLMLFHDLFFLPRMVRNENIRVLNRRKYLTRIKPGKTYTYNSTDSYIDKEDLLVQDMVKWGYLARIEKQSNLFDDFYITEKGIRMQREIKSSNY